MIKRPPIDEKPEYIVLHRSWRDDKVLLCLPCGDSYYMSRDDLEWWMTRVGFSEAASKIDFVWNFYRARVDGQTDHCWAISQDDFEMMFPSFEPHMIGGRL